MESFGIRSKRHAEVEDHTGFEEFPIPFLGAEVGVKYKDPSDHLKGGEAYFHIDDLPTQITNMQLDIESNRQTTFKAKYFNGPMNRDLTIDVVRVPGKSIKAIITNHGVTSTIEGILTMPSANVIEVKVDADIRGV